MLLTNFYPYPMNIKDKNVILQFGAMVKYNFCNLDSALRPRPKTEDFLLKYLSINSGTFLFYQMG